MIFLPILLTSLILCLGVSQAGNPTFVFDSSIQRRNWSESNPAYAPVGSITDNHPSPSPLLPLPSPNLVSYTGENPSPWLPNMTDMKASLRFKGFEWGMRPFPEVSHPIELPVDQICSTEKLGWPFSPVPEGTNRDIRTASSGPHDPFFIFGNGSVLRPKVYLPEDLLKTYVNIIFTFKGEESLLENQLLKNPLIRARLPSLSWPQISELSRQLLFELGFRTGSDLFLLKGYIYLTLSMAQETFPEGERVRWVSSPIPYLLRLNVETSPLPRLLLQDPFLFRQAQGHLSKVSPTVLLKLVPHVPPLAIECASLATSRTQEDPQMLSLFRESLKVLSSTSRLRAAFALLWRRVKEMAPSRAFSLEREDGYDGWNSSQYHQFRECFIALYDHLVPYDGHSLIGSLEGPSEGHDSDDAASLDRALLHHTWLALLLRERSLPPTVRFSPGLSYRTDFLSALEVLMRLYQFDPNLDTPLRSALANWVSGAVLLQLDDQPHNPNDQMRRAFNLLVAQGLPGCLDLWLSRLDATLVVQLASELGQLRDWRLLAVFTRHLHKSGISLDHMKLGVSSMLLNQIVLGAKFRVDFDRRRRDILILRLPAGSRSLSLVHQWTLLRALLLVHLGVPFWVISPSPPSLLERAEGSELESRGRRWAELLQAPMAPYLAPRFGVGAKLDITFQRQNKHTARVIRTHS